MPKPENSPSAVVVSGGKQYRVALGDRILVDRIAAEPGSSVKLDKVLLLSDGDDVKVGAPTVEGVDVDAKVLAQRRGPRIESLRYKSKKRVRVHHGGRAYLTALEIIAVGGVGLETEEVTEKEEAKPKGRGRKAAPKEKAAPKAKASQETEQETKDATQEAPAKKTTRRRTKKEDE